MSALSTLASSTAASKPAAVPLKTAISSKTVANAPAKPTVTPAVSSLPSQAIKSASSQLANLFLYKDDTLSPVSSASVSAASVPTSTVPTKASAAAPASTLVGSQGGLQINLVWGSSVSSAPKGFQDAIIAAAKIFTTDFSTNAVVNIKVSYGEVNGQAISKSALAQSQSVGTMQNYASVRTALLGDASSSSWQQTADATLSATDPTKGGKFFVTSAQGKALGFTAAQSTSLDGYIGLSSAVSFSFDPNARSVAGKYDAVGAAAHEISEVLGRIGSEGKLAGSNVYTAADLFRYSGTGTRALTPGAGYFSVDGGKTNLATYNNPNNGGDAADWTPSIVGNSFGSGYAGHASVVSSTDIIATAVLGYKMTTGGVAATKSASLTV